MRSRAVLTQPMTKAELSRAVTDASPSSCRRSAGRAACITSASSCCASRRCPGGARLVPGSRPLTFEPIPQLAGPARRRRRLHHPAAGRLPAVLRAGDGRRHRGLPRHHPRGHRTRPARRGARHRRGPRGAGRRGRRRRPPGRPEPRRRAAAAAVRPLPAGPRPGAARARSRAPQADLDVDRGAGCGRVGRRRRRGVAADPEGAAPGGRGHPVPPARAPPSGRRWRPRRNGSELCVVAAEVSVV